MVAHSAPRRRPHLDPLTAVERAQLVARAIGIVEGPVTRVLVEDDRLSGVDMDDGRVVRRAAVFVPPRFLPHNDLLMGLGCDLDDNGWVTTGPNGQTTIPGVWVAGNVMNPRAQVITAAGEGSAAAWLAVFPTLTVLNLALDDWLTTKSPVLRTFVLVTIAVPIVMYGLMPQLHRLRARLAATRGFMGGTTR